MTEQTHEYFLQRCLALAEQQACTPGGGPFAAIVVRDGEVIAEGCNQVTGNNDPTAHAEMVAIRKACAQLNDFQLPECILYSSCEPCPMCLGAIFWARPKAIYFAATRHQAADAGFDDGFIYQQIELLGEQRQIPFYHASVSNAELPFNVWRLNQARRDY